MYMPVLLRITPDMRHTNPAQHVSHDAVMEYKVTTGTRRLQKQLAVIGTDGPKAAKLKDHLVNISPSVFLKACFTMFLSVGVCLSDIRSRQVCALRHRCAVTSVAVFCMMNRSCQNGRLMTLISTHRKSRFCCSYSSRHTVTFLRVLPTCPYCTSSHPYPLKTIDGVCLRSSAGSIRVCSARRDVARPECPTGGVDFYFTVDFRFFSSLSGVKKITKYQPLMHVKLIQQVWEKTFLSYFVTKLKLNLILTLLATSQRFLCC